MDATEQLNIQVKLDVDSAEVRAAIQQAYERGLTEGHARGRRAEMIGRLLDKTVFFNPNAVDEKQIGRGADVVLIEVTEGGALGGIVKPHDIYINVQKTWITPAGARVELDPDGDGVPQVTVTLHCRSLKIEGREKTRPQDKRPGSTESQLANHTGRVRILRGPYAGYQGYVGRSTFTGGEPATYAVDTTAGVTVHSLQARDLKILK